VGSAGLVLIGQGGPGGGGSGSGGTLGVHDANWGSSGEATNPTKICGPAGGPVRRTGTGGPGGYGGKGGGGGGNGGPSMQLVSMADGALTVDANATLRYAGGRSGAGGTGSKGAQDNNAGPPGNVGSSANHMPIVLELGQVSASASSSYPGAPPANAVDSDPNTLWNSGGPPPAWIKLDLKRTVTLSKVRLLVGQSPAGATTHQLYFGSSPAPTAPIATLSSSTSDMQWLEVDFPDPKPTGRYLRVQTTASPSWVAWREIVVQTQ
jgi:hypothetical protein